MLFLLLLPFGFLIVAVKLVEKVPRMASSTIKAKGRVRAVDLQSAEQMYLTKGHSRSFEIASKTFKNL